MVTLLFDTTNILFRSLYAAQGYGSAQFSYDSSDECAKLMRKLCMDSAQIIRTINPQRVIFCKDASSWRKKIFIEENEGYKGQRVKDSFVNWNNVYGVLDEFLNIMKKNGYITSYIEGNYEEGGAEADDCIALWANELYENKNERVVIVSGDEDVRQVVRSKYVEDKYTFIAVFNPFKHGKGATKKLFYSGDIISWINSPSVMSLFEMTADGDKEDFLRIYNDKDITFEEVNGKEIVLRKLLCGDGGDNIPAFYTWQKVTAKGKETTDRITPSKYKKIVETLSLSSIDDLDTNENLSKLEDMLAGFSKNPVTCDVSKRFIRQRRLVELSLSQFPEHITEQFNATKDKIYKMPKVSNSMGIRMQDLLKGTNYMDDSNAPKGVASSVFSDIDKVIKSASLF